MPVGKLFAWVVVLGSIAMGFLVAFDFIVWLIQLVRDGLLVETGLNYAIRQLRLWAFILPVIAVVWVAIWAYGQKRKP